MQAVTIRDVAKRAGVGVATVSRVINGNRSVSQQTKEKVLRAIKALDYTPNAIARSLSSGKTFTIAVIAPFFTRTSYIERLHGIASILGDSEYDLIFYNVENSEYRDAVIQKVIQRERVDGLIIMSFSLNDTILDKLKQSNLSIVMIDVFHPEFISVVGDDLTGSYEAVNHLISLGHRRIGFVSDSIEDNKDSFTSVHKRYKGYRRALEDAGIPYNPEYHVEREYGRLEAEHMAHEILTLPNPPTAIFAFSDIQAYGVLQAAKKLQIRVPEELSVIGYDDIESADYMDLTTMRQKLFESGMEGAKCLVNALTSTEPIVKRRVLLKPELIIRQTTAEPLGYH